MFPEVGARMFTLFMLISGLKLLELLNKSTSSHKPETSLPTAGVTENAHVYTIFNGQESTCKGEVQVLQESSEFDSFKVFLL